MKKNLNILLLILLALQFIGISYAQTPTDKKVRYYVNGSNYPEIELIVGIRDLKTGEGLYGLQKKDFSILEKETPQEITSFLAMDKESSDVIDIVFLFDQTGSMGSVIQAVKDNALLFADILKKSDMDYRVALITFSDSIEKQFPFTKDIEQFKSNVGSISAVGGGDGPENALESMNTALKLQFRPNANTAFVLITDAPYHESDSCTPLAMKPLVKRLGLKNIQIYPITHPREEYRWMANETGGVHFNIGSDFSSIIEELAYGLSSQYKIRYITSQPCPDGMEMDVKLNISPIASTAEGKYKRPLNFAQLDINLSFAEEKIPYHPQNPIECDTVTFRPKIRGTCCSDSAQLPGIVVRLFDIRPGERTEVAASEPITLQSGDEAKTVPIEWKTTGFRGKRKLEFVIDSGEELLEKSKEDNILRREITFSPVAHDLYIESIDFSPNPVNPCDIVAFTVKINDGTKCQGMVLEDITVEMLDGSHSLGRMVTSLTVGNPAPVIFKWNADGAPRAKRLTFVVDPDRKFGKELTLTNNIKEILVDVKPVQHDLAAVKITHEPPKPMEGDEILFHVSVSDTGHCPDIPLMKKIKIRMTDSKSKRLISHSAPFTLSTGTNVVVPVKWSTRLKDQGKQTFFFLVDSERKVREKTPPGDKNNGMEYAVEVLPMPHDLVIKSATISPPTPRDGDSAEISVQVTDNARFPGVKLENIKLKAFERYTKVLLGTSEPAEILSQTAIKMQLPIDTGGLAGNREIIVVVDPDNEIKEFTPEGKDGENNNEYILKVTIKE